MDVRRPSSIHSNEAVHELAPVLGSRGESVGFGVLVIGTVAFDKFADAVEASRSAPELENAPGVCLISGDRILILADPEVDA